MTFFQRLARSACDVNTKHDSTMSPILCNMEMDVETTQIAAACLGIGTVILCRRQKRRRVRRIWVKPWISTREKDGAFHRLLKDLEGDPEHYSNYLRLDLATFGDFLLLALVVRRTCIKEAVCLCPTAY